MEIFNYRIIFEGYGDSFGITVTRRGETREELQTRGYLESLRMFAYDQQLPLFPESLLEQVKKELREKFEQGKMEKIVGAHIETNKELEKNRFVHFNDNKKDPLFKILMLLFSPKIKTFN